MIMTNTKLKLDVQICVIFIDLKSLPPFFNIAEIRLPMKLMASHDYKLLGFFSPFLLIHKIMACFTTDGTSQTVKYLIQEIERTLFLRLVNISLSRKEDGSEFQLNCIRIIELSSSSHLIKNIITIHN